MGLGYLGRYIGPGTSPDKGTSFRNQLGEIITVAGWRPEKGHVGKALILEVLSAGANSLSSLSVQGLGFPLGRVKFTGSRVIWKYLPDRL